MSVLRLSLLVQVGLVLVLGSTHRRADRSARDTDIIAHLAAGPRAHAHLRGSHAEGALPRAVSAFLHNGDPRALRHANCSRRYELASSAHAPPHRSLGGVRDAALRASSFLSAVLQANRSREASVRRDAAWYRALARSVLDGDARITRVMLAFNAERSAGAPSVVLQAVRAAGGIVLEDLSASARRRTGDTAWYHGVRERGGRRGETSITGRGQIRWSAPYLECEHGSLVPRWLVTLSTAFYGPESDQAADFRGAVRVDVSLQEVDIDQCSSDGWFAGTHQCNLTSMECVTLPGHGFVLDKYTCHCKTGFFHPNRVSGNGFKWAGQSEGSTACLPCQRGCSYCRHDDDAPCVEQTDGPLRLGVMATQGLCLLLLFLCMVLLYLRRRSKSIRASGFVLLEAILVGAILLYFPVFILSFQPSVFRCVLLRWVRLLGFSTVYGTITLKMYRVLKVFLSRSAQRVPYLTSWRLLRLLGVVLLVVAWFLVGWTASVAQQPLAALLDVGRTRGGLQFPLCLLGRWDYMMAVAESLFLLWGVYLCYAVRSVPSAFHEHRYMAIALHNELLLSAVFYVVRFCLAPELHPDWMLLLFFTHTHLTVTVSLGLLLVPKFLLVGTHTRDDVATETYEDELDMGRSGSYLNSSITSAWSEHSLDPDDIREELKKLYSQLEVYKRKKMLANNPHLQKKRSSKKGLGRSLMRRITEIPESVHRQCSREDKEPGDHVTSRSSICVLRKNPLELTHQGKPAKEEILKNKVFSLKKSHSSYDHVREQSEDSSSSVTDKMEVDDAESLISKTLVKKRSIEKIEAPNESTESVPLVCKSVSAHNLSADKKPLNTRTSMLQKSLSVIASAKERTLGLTGKTHMVEDSNKKSPPKSTEASGGSEDECQPKMVGSQSAESKQPAATAGIMKQQAGGSQPHVGCARTKELYNLSEVCPWEVEDLPTPSENKLQKHVSIAPKETTTVHGSGPKAARSQQQKQSNGRHSKEILRMPAGRAEMCPWEGVQPQLPPQVSQAARSPQSHSSMNTSQTRRADVCPWDYEEAQTKTSPDMTKQRGAAAPVEGDAGSGYYAEPAKAGGSLQALSSKVDVCPWDYDADAPSRVSTAKEKRSVSSRAAEDETKRIKSKDKSKRSEKLARLPDRDVECHQPPPVEIRRSANVGAAKPKSTDICPWDFEKTSDNTSKDKTVSTTQLSNANPKGELVSAPNRADVCPWDFDESTSGKPA